MEIEKRKEIYKGKIDMKYLILIDRSTIKANPNAGRKEYMIPGPWRSDGNNGLERDIQIVRTLIGEPAYFYKHIDTTVQCEYCCKQFSHTLLYDSWDDDVEVSRTCPYCHNSEYCEIEYQNISAISKVDLQ